MSLEETLFTMGINGGLSGGLGYAAGRITRMAVDIVKWIIGAVVAFQLLLSHLGVITIHFDRLNEVLSSLLGSSEPSVIMNEVTHILITVIPSTLGLGAGFYAGYKKLII
jgi:uncharacterized membrane protein (Fun14 family)